MPWPLHRLCALSHVHLVRFPWGGWGFADRPPSPPPPPAPPLQRPCGRGAAVLRAPAGLLLPRAQGRGLLPAGKGRPGRAGQGSFWGPLDSATSRSLPSPRHAVLRSRQLCPQPFFCPPPVRLLVGAGGDHPRGPVCLRHPRAAGAQGSHRGRPGPDEGTCCCCCRGPLCCSETRGFGCTGLLQCEAACRRPFLLLLPRCVAIQLGSQLLLHPACSPSPSPTAAHHVSPQGNADACGGDGAGVLDKEPGECQAGMLCCLLL